MSNEPMYIGTVGIAITHRSTGLYAGRVSCNHIILSISAFSWLILGLGGAVREPHLSWAAGQLSGVHRQPGCSLH